MWENKIYSTLKSIEDRIILLNKKIESEPLNVKKEIDEILEKNSELIEWYTTKVELLKTKAAALINLWDIDETEKIYNTLEKYITEKINISFNEKENTSEKDKFLLEIIEEKLEIYARNTWLAFDTKKDKKLYLNNEKIQKFVSIFEENAEKLNKLWKIDIVIYNMWMFFYNLSQNEKAIELIESAALLWNKKAIDFYTDFIINYFIWNYNLVKTEKEKEDFLENNLKNTEDVLFQFIDEFYFDEKNKKIKLIQWWNKYLYEKIWNFYSKIENFSESLSSYKSWIQSGFEWNHKLYKNIAELYQNFKYEIKAFDIVNIDELIKDNYRFLYEYSGLVWDLENIVYWLEKLWDIANNSDKELSKNYYYKALSKIIDYNYTDYNSIVSTTRLMEKLSLKQLLLKYPDWDITIEIEKLYIEITQNFDQKYILSLANHHEEIWDILWAYQDYLNAFQAKIPGWKDALLIFLETSLVSYIEKEASEFNLNLENDKNILEKSEIEYEQELNLDELMKKKQLISKIIKSIDENNKILREQIATLFDMSLWDEFYNNFEYKQLLIFIELYNQWINNADIYLHRILENIFSWNGTNLKSPSIKELLKKIYNKQELSKNDIEGIYNILNLENKQNNFKYTLELMEIQNKSKK